MFFDVTNPVNTAEITAVNIGIRIINVFDDIAYISPSQEEFKKITGVSSKLEQFF